jgi:hypothetical protein
MFNKLVPLSKESHKGLKINPPQDLSFAKNTHLVALMAPEFPRAQSEMPVVFVEGENGDFKTVAMLGIKPGINLMINEHGKWTERYVPAILRRYPFALATGPNAQEFAVCIDEESPAISADSGEALFDEAGEPTKLLESAKDYLLELRKMELQTDAFCKLLQEHNLLAPLNMRVKEGEEVKNITGVFAINAERFDKLSDEVFLEFRKRGYLPLIYAHLGSLSQIDKLMRLAAATSPAAKVDAEDENMH